MQPSLVLVTGRGFNYFTFLERSFPILEGVPKKCPPLEIILVRYTYGN